MFENFPHLFRLLVCLVLSTGLHAGLVLYDRDTPPAGTGLSHAPVTVSLLPATDVVLPAENNISAPVATPVAPRATPLPVVAQASVKALRSKRPVPDTSPASKDSRQARVVEAASLQDVEPGTGVSSLETVCLPPQGEPAESSQLSWQPSPADADVTGAATALTGSTNKQKAVAFQRLEEGGASSTPLHQDLVEAVPDYLSNPLPEYPYLARKKHWEGVVWLLVDVAADGSVDKLRVDQSCGHRVLDRTASQAVRRWQFTPAKRAGLPVFSQVRVPVRFQLEDD